jgi:hypothetical protein
MSKTSSLSKTPNVSTASEIRTPRPYLPTSSAPATLASLAISQISVAKPEAEFLEFHEDPTTKKVKPLPDLSAPLAMVAEEKTPPPAHPLPPVLLTLDEARVGPASRTPAPLAPGAAVGSRFAVADQRGGAQQVNQAALKSCYERALKMDNHLTSGRIDVTVSIGMSGMVQRVVINAPSASFWSSRASRARSSAGCFRPAPRNTATNFPLIMQGGM